MAWWRGERTAHDRRRATMDSETYRQRNRDREKTRTREKDGDRKWVGVALA